MPFLVFLFLCSTAFADAPIEIQILNFGGTNHWQATETTLSADKSGRYQAKNTRSFQLGGCEDFLTNFQQRPLSAMLKNNYISEDTYKFLMEKLKDRLDGRQLLLVSSLPILISLMIKL